MQDLRAIPAATDIELSVIAPCLNEEHNVPELVRRLLHVFDVGGLRGEVVLVDDGSTDGTAAVIARLGWEHPEVVVGVTHRDNRGMAAAWQSALSASRGRLVATIDADLQYQPEDLLRLVRKRNEQGVDIVQGYRSSVGRQRDHRYVLSRGLNLLLNGAFAMNLQDNKSGFVVCAREVLADLLRYRGKYFYWQSFVMVAAKSKGYSFAQIETIFEPRRQGTSFLDGKAGVTVARSLVDIGRAVWEYRISPSPDVVTPLLGVASEIASGVGTGPVARPATSRPAQRPAPTAAQTVRWQAYLATFNQSHWMITRDVEHHLETLERTQWLDGASTRELQDEKLRRMVRHAYHHVPFYRDRMSAARVRPDDIRGQADLHKLPLLSKAEVREHLYLGLLSDDHDKTQVLRVATTGSTGEPLVVYADRAQLELRWAATLRAQHWTGYRFGDPTVRLWHQTLGLTRAQARRERLDAVLSRRTFVPVFELTEGNLTKTLDTLSRARPVLIDGYAEALDFLARRLQSGLEAGAGLRSRPRAVMTSAQTLPQTSRALIEQAFGCKVFDKYGSREFSGIAYECEAHEGHHVVAEAYIVEVLREGRPAAPGEVGEIVVTDLENRCMPLIRYRIGNLAEAMGDAQTCPCGRGAPRIGAIEGRVQSIILGEGGRYLPGTFFAHCLKEYDHAIRRFQVEQTRPNAITFRIVKAGRFSNDVLDDILATFRRYLGRGMQIDVEFVEDVAMARTGKRLIAVSRLDVDFQRSAPTLARAVSGR